MGKGALLLWVPSAPAHEWRGQGALPAVQGMVMSPSLGSRGGGRMWGCTGTVWPQGAPTLSQNLGRGCGGYQEVQGLVVGDQSFNWVGGREGHSDCAWGAPGEALVQEASSFLKFLQLPQPLSGYPSSGTAAIEGLPVVSSIWHQFDCGGKSLDPPEDLSADPLLQQ